MHAAIVHEAFIPLMHASLLFAVTGHEVYTLAIALFQASQTGELPIFDLWGELPSSSLGQTVLISWSRILGDSSAAV